MKYLLLVFLFTKYIHVYSSRQINVYLSFNECVSCYSALTSLNELNNFGKQIIISSEDSLVAKEFFESFELPNQTHLTFIKDMQWSFSYCKILSDKILIDSFPLRILSSKINLYNHFGEKGIHTFFLPKNAIFKTDRIALFANKNQINVYDYILNKDILFSVRDNCDTLSEILSLKGKQFSPALFLKSGNFDTVFYNKQYPALKKMGKGYPHVESAYLSDSTLYLLLNFPFPIQLPNDLAVDMRFFIYSCNLYTHSKKLTYIDEKTLAGKIKDDYYIDNTRPFFIENNQLFLSIYSDNKIGNKVDLLSLWSNNRGAYNYDRSGIISVEKQYYNIHEIDSFGISINSKLYFSENGKIVINHRTKSIVLTNGLNLKESVFIMDVELKDNSLRFLTLNDKDILELIDYDIKKQMLVGRSPIKFPEDGLANSAKFFGPNSRSVVLFNKAATKLYQLSIPD